MGLLKMDNIHSPSNLIFLCGSCHTAYDEPVPAWIFLPVHLDGFVKTEEKFQKSRRDAAGRGEKLTRKPPTEGPWRRYERYQILEQFVNPKSFKKGPIRWAGSPIAAIAHSASVIGRHVRLPPEKYGIPDYVAKKLGHLLFLYGKPEPPVTTNGHHQPHDSADDEDDGSSIKSFGSAETIAYSHVSLESGVGPLKRRKRRHSTPELSETEQPCLQPTLNRTGRKRDVSGKQRSEWGDRGGGTKRRKRSLGG